MYNKLFTKILDSSIWLAPDPHRLVWITLIAAMDQDSLAPFACAENLAARARVSLKETEEALAAFQAPDPHDPTQEFDGRRIERVPGGWFILNGEKYRSIVSRSVQSEQSRERMRKWREKKKKDYELHSGRNVTQPLQSVTPSDMIRHDHTQSRAEEAQRNVTQPDSAHESEGQQARDWIREHYPSGTARKDWQTALKRAAALVDNKLATWQQLIDCVQRYVNQQTALAKIGSEYILAPHNFFDPKTDNWRQDYPLPEKPETPMERILRKNGAGHERAAIEGSTTLAALGSDVWSRDPEPKIR